MTCFRKKFCPYNFSAPTAGLALCRCGWYTEWEQRPKRRSLFVLEQYVNQLLNMSTRIGVLMLQSGAEIYRVEDSVHRIHMAYCAGESQVYCVPTTVIATVSLPGGEKGVFQAGVPQKSCLLCFHILGCVYV